MRRWPLAQASRTLRPSPLRGVFSGNLNVDECGFSPTLFNLPLWHRGRTDSTATHIELIREVAPVPSTSQSASAAAPEIPCGPGETRRRLRAVRLRDGRDDRQFKAEPLFRGIVPRRLGRGDRIRISSSLLDCPNFAATCHGIHNRLSDFPQANAIDARVNQATEINCCANGFDALEVGWAHPRCDFGNISLRPQRIGRSSLNADVVDKVF